jgi:hypothetical protein
MTSHEVKMEASSVALGGAGAPEGAATEEQARKSIGIYAKMKERGAAHVLSMPQLHPGGAQDEDEGGTETGLVDPSSKIMV